MLGAMQQSRLGPLDVRITGGVDDKGGGDGPVVVLLHGFGAPGDDLVPLWRTVDLPSDVRWAFPAAPLEMPSMGFGMESRAWWMIDMEAIQRAMATGQTRDLSTDSPAGLDEARAQLLETLTAIEQELTPSKMVLGGFSQGAMLALDVALHSERPLAGVIELSGTYLAADEWAPRMSARAGLPVFQSHGQLDPLLPFTQAERLRDVLVAAGLPVDFVPFRGGHEIPPVVLSGLQSFLTRTVG